ncbi:MAG: lysophospholipid acyltransferase family protein [Bacteroidetes bacterium]|nr:lysophospholipid acyltransferase family protein [Bacteroidota bacterium]
MNKIQKLFFYYPIKILSLLPLQALYFITYPFYWLLFYCLKYRRKVTRQNLLNSFPNKSKNEIKEIEKKYYKHLSRLFAEFIKGISIGENELKRRVILHNREVLQNIYNNHGASIVLLGHYGNWELIAQAAELIAPHHFCIVYKPLHNYFFNDLIYKSRTKFGAETIPMEATYDKIKNSQKEKVLFTLVADQSPSNLKNVRWINFLNQKTAFMSGAELLHKRLDIPICYLSVKSSKSGYYDLYPKVIIESKLNNSNIDIIALYAEMLQNDIEEKPELWLWSHKRWKHKHQKTD